MRFAWIDRLISRGVKDSDTIDRKLTIRAYNFFNFLLILILSSYLVVYLLAEAKLLTGYILFSLSATLLINFIFKIETHFLWTRIFAFFNGLAVITFVMIVLGPGRGIEICYLTFISVLPMIFDPTERKWIAAGIGLTALTYGIVSVVDLQSFRYFNALLDEPSHIHFFKDLNFYSTMVVIGYSLILTKTQQRTVQIEFDKQRALMADASRLASLGEMAGGIAHEINNPLQVIAGATEQILLRKKENRLDDEFLDRSLGRSLKMTRRISAIVSGMKKLAHGDNDEPNQTENVADLFREVAFLCEERIKHKNIRLDIQIPKESLWISCRSDQMLQVLINLMNNSIDAVEELSDRWIVLSCTVAQNEIWLSVTDSGSGIPKDVVEKMFNPFFTTKIVGKGTGLGLSISKGILSKFNGNIRVDPECKNTRFIISLPKAYPANIAS